MTKKAFYFILKSIFFVLKIFKFLYWLFSHVEKSGLIRKKVNFKIYDVTAWLTSNDNTHNYYPTFHEVNISQSKGNQTIKFGQLIE